MVVDKDNELCLSAEDYEIINKFSCLLSDILCECGCPIKKFKLTSERGLVFTDKEIIELCLKLDILDLEYISVKEMEGE